jgi:hypothetical protein
MLASRSERTGVKAMRFEVRNDRMRRTVSANSKADAAKIFLSERRVSEKPRRLGEEPACYVKSNSDETPF